MPLRVHTSAGRAVIALPEEVDINNIEAIRVVARTQVWGALPQLREIVFDLTGTAYFGTEAVHLIRDTRRRGLDHGVCVFVVCLSPMHRRLLSSMGLGPDIVPPDPAHSRIRLPRQRGPSS
ncbi:MULTISPECIES: STAS domain-containing protein [Streptacidiphilus]|uniref:STAS domain-containing protein n=1 Tax=Streptacidiphilus cavernicola TaxID=3342716 RepID=A0ABV6UK63_9ACTN|nr:STAS domain-containing protein [Streptacidiphilus jeojiense]